jgi:hypothetical protein
MARARLAVVPVVAAAAMLASACGASGSHATTTHSAPKRTPVQASGTGLPGGLTSIPTPGPTGLPPSTADVRVITSWANALRHGNLHAAAALFKIPSALINGPDANGELSVIVIHNLAQAVAAQESLPCGAKFVSADQRGRFVNALFELTGRSGPGGSNCAGSVGVTARTNFLIEEGRIVDWIRAPDDPGDNGSPPAQGGNTGPSA